MTTIFSVLLTIAVTISASLILILIHNHLQQKKAERLAKRSRMAKKHQDRTRRNTTYVNKVKGVLN